MDPGIRALFHPAPGLTYLDTATYGLPPEPAMRAMREAEDSWTAGTGRWVDWDRESERARAAFAQLVNVAPSRVALLPSVSVGMGVVTADLRPGDRVVVPTAEFRSVLYPLLVAQQRGVEVVEADVDRLIEAITPGTTLVALSLVQMQTGRVLPVGEIVDRATQAGARVLLDATHGVPFVSLDGVIDRIDYVLVHGYKHLLCPRGVSFMVLGQEQVERLPPIASSWRASDNPYTVFFGGPLSFAEGAARHDASLPWHPWVFAATSLELLVEWQAAGHLEEPVQLARDLADRLGIAWGGATLVCPQIDDPERAGAALAAHRIKAAFRGTAVRFSTHVYNDAVDIERAATAIGPLIAQPVSR
ncbi:MAG TPA: aminotransferase class V-fold PLP-dependent enzyme [Candidatus Limnocylindrales bacterium]|nr:aminotransferase class V-fold PLP-dependent enzyme [Candidatus Limnocylindrales bacterium]